MTKGRGFGRRCPLGLLCACFVGGVAVGIVLAFKGTLNWTGDVTGGNILQSLATIVCAWFIASYIQRSLADRNHLKKWLLDQCACLRGAVDALEEADGEQGERLQKVCAKLKKVSVLSQAIGQSLTNSGCPSSVLAAARFKAVHRDLRVALTDTPRSAVEQFARTEECPAEVKDDIIMWSAERTSEIDQKMMAFRSKLSLLELEIIGMD